MLFEKIHEKDLLSLMENTQALSLFTKDYFPELVKMDNGDLYVLTNKFVYSSTGSMHYKFFHFDKDGKLLTDPSYNYTLLNKDGYLMRISIRYPVTSIEFNVDYLIKMDNIEYRQDISVGNSFQKDRNNISHLLSFQSLDIRENIAAPFKDLILNHKDFFINYLDFDLNGIQSNL